MDDGGSPLKQIKKGWRFLFRKGQMENPDDVTEEGIISMVKEGHEQGVILASEAEMIHNIFEFSDKDAKDIMTHRKHIAALDGDSTFREMLAYIEEQNYSRYPVYQEDIDNIIGVIHIKDVLNFILRQDVIDQPVRSIEGLLHDIPFIPETRSINDLLRRMQTNKMHMAVVVDEYGQTSGIVTLEDIIEEIMGNIQDEHDQEELAIVRQNDESYLMDGMAPLHEVCEMLNINHEELKEYDTLNGFLVSLIDKIPSDGEQFHLDAYGYRFDVLLVENKLIKKVKVTKNESLSETEKHAENR